MKRQFLLAIMAILFFPTGFAQDANHNKGGAYTKKCSYNLVGEGDTQYNLSDKSVLDRILFGSTNSLVEYVFQASLDQPSVLALRIVNEGPETYRLETLTMENREEVAKMIQEVSAETGRINVPGKLQAQLPMEVMEKIGEHNKNVRRNSLSDEPYKSYRPEPKSFNISQALAEKIHEKTALLTKNFTGTGSQRLIADGNTVTYRCVTGDEVRSLTVHSPQSGAQQLSDVCLEIIRSYGTADNDEHYIELLDKITL